MIKINYKKDNMYGDMMYEFIKNDLIMKWFTDRSGDLYWVLFCKKIKHNDEYCFEIGINNYKLYAVMENLYNDFKNGTIFHKTEIDDSLKYDANTLNKTQNVRTHVREIYNSNTEEIYWKSDEDNQEHTNEIRIVKQKNKFIIHFKDVIHGKLIRVCFKKNRGYYGPCSLPFYRAYDSIYNIKDNYNATFEEYFDIIKPKIEDEQDEKKYVKKSEN